jgi:hypothetical protein
MKLETKFIDSNGVIKGTILEISVDMKKYLDQTFPQFSETFDETTLIIIAKFTQRLLEVYTFYQKAHSPCLFMSSTNASDKIFKFSKDLGRNFDLIDQSHFIQKCNTAENHLNNPLSLHRVCNLFKLDNNMQMIPNKRIKSKMIYRSQETKMELKYNESVSSKCKSLVQKELQPVLLSYLCCCLKDSQFCNVSLCQFSQDSTPFKYNADHYLEFQKPLLSMECWTKSILDNLTSLLAIRFATDIRDGCARNRSRRRRKLDGTTQSVSDDSETAENLSECSGEVGQSNQELQQVKRRKKDSE